MRVAHAESQAERAATLIILERGGLQRGLRSYAFWVYFARAEDVIERVAVVFFLADDLEKAGKGENVRLFFHERLIARIEQPGKAAKRRITLTKIFFKEHGRAVKRGFAGGEIELAAARDIRNILQGFSSGLSRYYHFAQSVWPDGSSWSTLFAGSPANGGVPVPNPTLYALRTVSDRLEQAKPVKRLKLGVDYRCAVFDHGNKRTAVLWKWNGNPGTLRFQPGDAGKVSAYDFVGSRIPAATIPMNEYPVYLDSALSAAELEKLIERIEEDDDVQNVYHTMKMEDGE